MPCPSLWATETNTSTQVFLRELLTPLDVYNYNNGTAVPAVGGDRTLGDGGGPGGSETGQLTGTLAPGSYQFFYRVRMQVGQFQVERDFDGQIGLQLTAVPVPGAILLLAPALLLLLSRRTVPAAS